MEEQEGGEGTNKRLGYIWVDGAGPVDHIVRTLKNDIIGPHGVSSRFSRDSSTVVPSISP